MVAMIVPTSFARSPVGEGLTPGKSCLLAATVCNEIVPSSLRLLPTAWSVIFSGWSADGI